MEGLALTGAWVDREQGLVSTIVLEMGGSSNLCALLAAGRAGRADGPDRRADRDRVRRDGDPGRRRPGQRGAVLDRRGVPGARITGSLFRRLQEGDRPLQGRQRSRPPPTWWSGAATRRPDSRRRDRRTAVFVGNIVQAMLAYGSGDLGEALIPMRDADRIVAIGSDRMMAAVALARHRELAAAGQAGALRDRIDQLPDAVHDEGDLRPVPAAAARPGDRPDALRLLLLQPGPAARPGRLRDARTSA